MPDSTAAEFRAAATRLRNLAQAASADLVTNAYWNVSFSADSPRNYCRAYAEGVQNGLGGAAGDLAAAMHPGVAVALADTLDAIAAHTGIGAELGLDAIPILKLTTLLLDAAAVAGLGEPDKRDTQ